VRFIVSYFVLFSWFNGSCLCIFAHTISRVVRTIVKMSVFSNKFMIRIIVRMNYEALGGLMSYSVRLIFLTKNVDTVESGFVLVASIILPALQSLLGVAWSLILFVFNFVHHASSKRQSRWRWRT